LISSLKKIATDHLFEEKILICPGFETGHQILQNLSLTGQKWLNFHVKTLLSIAEETAAPKISASGKKRISFQGQIFLVDTIFSSLYSKKKLVYFEKLEINSGLVRAITRNINELKSAAVCPGDIMPEDFLVPGKGRDIKLIFSEYEHMLAEKNLLDRQDILNAAVKVLAAKVSKPAANLKEGCSARLFIAPARFSLCLLEREFLDALLKSEPESKLIVLPEPYVAGVSRPKNRLAADDAFRGPQQKMSSLGYLFAPGEADLRRQQGQIREEVKISVFSASDYRSEVYSILGSLAAEGTGLDQAEIVITHPDPYLELIENICEKTGTGATFAQGLPGDKSKTGRALKGFLLWIQEDFPEVHLRNLIKYGLLDFSGISPASSASGVTFRAGKGGRNINPAKLANFLRTSNIGWGRHRYKMVLEKDISASKLRLKQAVEEKDMSLAGRLEEKIFNLGILEAISAALLGLVPETVNGTVDFGGFCSCCLGFLALFVKTAGEEEGIYLQSLKAELEGLKSIVEGCQPSETAAGQIIKLAGDIRYAASGPKPGRVHVSSTACGGLSGRKNIFIAGLDEYRFPGTQIQDPVLLDEERAKISPELMISEAALKEKLYDFASLLGGLEGKVIFSFSFFDPGEKRDLFPSSLLLQVYRLKCRNKGADFEEMLNFLSARQIHLQPVDRTGLWLEKLPVSGEAASARELIFKVYPWLSEGRAAEEERQSSSLTAYDGFMDSSVPGGELDPRLNKGLVFSCTAYELFSRSPYTFFIEHVLGAKRPQETRKDLSCWLDAAKKGSLLHEVYQQFMEWFVKIFEQQGFMPAMQLQKEKAAEILENAVGRYREEVPVPGETVCMREVSGLKRDLAVFLEVNRGLGIPYELEFAFGYAGKKPVSICVGTGSGGEGIFINVSGKIDRIDLDEKGNYQVWDYKTGSTYGYDGENYVAGGKQLQHILYSKVIDAIADREKYPGSKVNRCGYVFPTEKGQDGGRGCIFGRDPGMEEKWQGAMACILEMMGKGVFIISDEDAPVFSDDEDLYGTKLEKKRIKAKLENPLNHMLMYWKDLKKFR
jgi:hypothetical protein